MRLRNLIPARFRKNMITIPVVRLSGVIAASNSPLSRNLNLANVASLLEKAFKMKHAPTVALVVNSPGGSPVQSRLIYTRIRELAAKHEKKVLVFVEDVAASGGYMISLAGDEIFADETSIIGSIGVISASFGFDKAIKKIGVERRVYTAGKNKVSLDPFQPENPKDVEYLKKMQLEIHDVFINMVKKTRGEKLAEDDDMFTGRFWTGSTAKDLGLIDGLGHLGTILKERFGEKSEFVLMQPRRSLLGRNYSVGINAITKGDSIGADLVDRAIDRMEEHVIRSRFGL
ncbi:MAG: S49 family peptidase [Hyphomicrobiales bacterium]|nr:S49 family peptidase [Hyphomicrobiales bacterium]